MQHVFVSDLHHIMGAIQSVVKTFEILATMYTCTCIFGNRNSFKYKIASFAEHKYILFYRIHNMKCILLYGVNHYYF